MMMVFLAFIGVLFAFGPSYAEKAGSVQLLTCYETPWSESPIWVWNPPDPAVWTRNESGTIATLHIPPSNGAKALIFEIVMGAGFAEATGTTELKIQAFNWLKVISDIIPPDVVVELTYGHYSTQAIPQDGFRPALPERSKRRVDKWLMWPNEEAWWWVGRAEGEDPVPPDQKKSLIRKLIKKGFDLEVSYHCWVKGIAEVALSDYDIFIYSTDLELPNMKAETQKALGQIQKKERVIR